MAEDNTVRNSIYNANDSLDINELASLNDDISTEFIEQLQNQVAQNASQFTGKPVNTGDDSELFEEVSAGNSNGIPKVSFDENIDDNFIKKYKAKINKQQVVKEEAIKEEVQENKVEESKNEPTKIETETPIQPQEHIEIKKQEQNISIEQAQPSKLEPESQELNSQESNEEIKNLTSGNIIEKPIEQEQLAYNESLDFLDNNVKYSKYVIYIDPENKDFIESLTVKERKNLINRILREQDDVAITKKRLNLIQTIIKHSVIAIVTISIAIPVIYWTINASLEASINNYRRSQTIFKTLYREKGKIKKTQQNY